MHIRIAGKKRESLIDGPGICFVIFMQGCLRNCPGCHNPEALPLDGGLKVSLDEIYREIKASKGIDSVVFSGGEPFLQAAPLSFLAQKICGDGLRVITYTGYIFEDLFYDSRDDDCRNLLTATDILIDGAYIEQERDINLAYRGSGNQRIIDVKQSIRQKKTVTLDYDRKGLII